MRIRNDVIRTVMCTAMGLSAATAGTTHHSGDRACHWSSADRTLRLLSESFLRVQRHNGERVFSAVPINRTKAPALTIGIAY
jgi:hypothetical protein